ncbi:MAG TPA: T9SS type A sorting domain-containing protein [Saprospiraceae bacterium]|nr:T9SS type A sorting domain-containing protein [Saprospiraceae bacterium]
MTPKIERMKKLIVLGLMVFVSLTGFTQVQLPDSCKLEMGVNMAGLADYGTEIPFVDLMHTARVWYTKSIGDPSDYFDSGFADELSYREDGYPTHLPQMVDSSAYPQIVATIWAITDAWPAGQYTVLWEGTGTLDFIGPFQNLQQTNPHRIVFDYPTPLDGALEMRIEASDSLDPIRNIRVLMPGTEFTYESQPFYQLWLDKVNIFNTVRFMDWGQTNNWGLSTEDGYGDSLLVDWDGRSKMDHYTWAYNKGVPYEMMVRYMNENDKDGWVCIPHSASEDYIRNMARYFRDNLEPDRHIFVEYSNEIWNWIFAQTNWAYKYGCLNTGVTWPEGTVPFIQRALNYWTEEYAGQLERTTRVVGVFTGWLDVAQRVAFNLDPNSFDAVSPTFYFSFDELLDEGLDSLGVNATVSDVALAARLSQPANFEAIKEVKEFLADSLGKPIVFYEGGQHLTPHPFGSMPTYEQALLDIQRDTSMYNLYNEWLDMIRTLQEGEEPLLLMNFGFIGARSAQYGSWGILETMDQDFSVVPAPKYQAILENMNTNCQMVATESPGMEHFSISLEPNPTSDHFVINGPDGDTQVSIFDVTGVLRQKVAIHPGQSIDVRFLPKGMYFVSVNRQVLKLMIY